MMNENKVKRMASRVAADEDDEAFANVDKAVDTLIAAYKTIQENLPHAKTENVPQRAALDNIQELMDEAIGPYLADVVQAMQVFGE